jgi:hypothetical protein
VLVDAVGRAAWRVIASLVALAPLAVSCDAEPQPARRLVDGTPARLSSVVFEGVHTPVVATTRRVQRDARLECGVESGAGLAGVHRVGLVGRSLTVVASREQTVRACDRTGTAEWCGAAFARSRDGVELDAGLSITCRGDDGAAIGFSWVDPGEDAAYVVVAERGVAEAYEVVPGEVVRVTTTRVDVDSSSARIEVSEHTRRGRLLRSYAVEPQVAG